MSAELNNNVFLVKGRPEPFKAENDYDIYDSTGRRVILTCREKKLGRFMRLLRFTSLKATIPFDLKATTPEGKQVLRMARGIPVTASKVTVYDENDMLIGGFIEKSFSLSGAYDVADAEDHAVCRLKGNLMGLEFSFLAPGEVELARVTRKWAGLRKEMLTSADDYLLTIDDAVPKDSLVRKLILASVLCVDLVQKVLIP